MDVDVPADAPLRRPTAPARRTLCWAQIVLGMLVVIAAYAVGGAVQERGDARAATGTDAPVVLDEAVIPPPVGEPALARGAAAGSEVHRHSVSGSDTVGDGALAAVGTLIVGATLTASAGTIGRRRLDDHEAARWDSDWARVEPVWSGRV